MIVFLDSVRIGQNGGLCRCCEYLLSLILTKYFSFSPVFYAVVHLYGPTVCITNILLSIVREACIWGSGDVHRNANMAQSQIVEELLKPVKCICQLQTLILNIVISFLNFSNWLNWNYIPATLTWINYVFFFPLKNQMNKKPKPLVSN